MKKINTDSIPTEDLLNRKKFAGEISKSLKLSFNNGEDSFVFGLNGKWGSGKTTLMQYLKEALHHEFAGNKKFVLFDFNPWMFSGRDELLSSFLNQLAKEVSLKNVKLKAKLSSFADALAYLDWVKYVHPTAGKIQQETKNIIKGLAAKPNIQELKKEIDDIIIENELRIFVFLDDLDRLTPKEVIEIFQIVKLNASFKNTIFAIAYDKEVVQNVIEDYHGFSGEKYLEKIIQVDYRIPDLMEETLHEVFFKTLKEFLADLEVSYDQNEFEAIWLVKRLKFYFVTLRDIHRYFNALKLRLPAIKNDVNLYQFCIIEAIRVFDYSAYEVIQKHYKKGIQFGPQTESSKINHFENENTQVLYNYLFGKTHNTIENYFISNPQYFDRYFTLSISKVDIKEETVQRFIQDSESRIYIVQTARCSIRRFVGHL
jgi:predicted KAP-like P-loop ATPase